MSAKTTPRSIPTPLSIKASSKSSKLGRFPPVPMRKTSRKCEYFESVLDELRRRSLRGMSSSESSSLVERERTAFEEVHRSHHRLSARDDEDKNERRRQRKRRSLYVTLKNENLYNLYAMETMACSTTSGMNTLDDEGKEDRNDYVILDFAWYEIYLPIVKDLPKFDLVIGCISPQRTAARRFMVSVIGAQPATKDRVSCPT